MKAKIFIFVFFLLISSLIIPKTIKAEENNSDTSANFAGIISVQKNDHRVEILRKYLESMNSPLASFAQDFVIQADAYNLPWELVPAISGTESTLGQAVPTNCNNPFGFGIYTDHMTCFESYPLAIQTVSKSLREDYINKWKAQTVDEIGAIYAASPTWSIHTHFFIDQIEKFKSQYENQSLSISL